MPEENEKETTAENGVVNAFVNAADNESLNAAETARNHADTVENAAEIKNEPLVNAVDNAADNAVDNELSMPVDQSPSQANWESPTSELETSPSELETGGAEDLEDEESPSKLETGEEEEDEFDFPEDDFEEEEEDDDVLGSYAEDELNGTKSVEEVVNNATGDSAKNLDALKDLGELVIDFLDDSKAQVCSAISGQPSSQYASGQKLNKALLKAFVAYMDSQEVRAPTPLGTLLLTLALWGLPALGTAYFHRRKAKKAKKQQTKEAIHQEVNSEELESKSESDEDNVPVGEAKSDTPDSETSIDYTQTKEYKDKRRMFDLHANTGCYSRDLTGKFAKTSLAGEKPSSELQALIDQGFDNTKIRSIIYPK